MPPLDLLVGNQEAVSPGANQMFHVSMLVPSGFEIVKIKITPEGQKRISKLLAKGEFGSCLGCEHEFTAEDIEAGKRKCGQCETCYNGTLYAIRKKRTT